MIFQNHVAYRNKVEYGLLRTIRGLNPNGQEWVLGLLSDEYVPLIVSELAAKHGLIY
jgi:hypothetical protein